MKLMTFIRGLIMVISVFTNGLEIFVKIFKCFGVYLMHFGFLVLRAMEPQEIDSVVASASERS